jgi:hypothetical protein
VVIGVSEEHSASIFRIKLKMKAACSSDVSNHLLGIITQKTVIWIFVAMETSKITQYYKF